MTLKEKFLPRMYCFMGSGMLSNTYDQKIAEDNAKECVELAEDFAIGFAEWTHSLRDCEKDSKEYNLYFNTSNKELLEIYKKDNKL